MEKLRSKKNNHPEYLPFNVYRYSHQKLLELLADRSTASLSDLKGKAHSFYFKEYFSYLGATTIVAENYYIDKDYLEDFSEYYVSCFGHYRKSCTRLHFFKNSFNTRGFRSVLSGGYRRLERSMQNGYLGFIVVKPLPKTIVGRTCLRVYDNDGNKRNYRGVTPYKVNLFGLIFEVESLAFQEQDQVVAACATNALWSAFQVTGHLFQHEIPSPSAITKKASKHGIITERSFPSQGLTLAQMAGVVSDLGMEPYKINVDDGDLFKFKSVVYGYLRLGIPALFLFWLVDKVQSGEKTEWRVRGRHAVAITGYRLAETLDENLGLLCTEASRVNELYVHDDGVGPFARMRIDEFEGLVRKKVIDGDGNTHIFIQPEASEQDAVQSAHETDHEVVNCFALTTSWPGESDGRTGNTYAIPETILIPLNKKMRIPIVSIINKLEQLYCGLFILNDANFSKGVQPHYKSDFCWDIHLTTVNELKTSLRSSGLLGEQLRKVAVEPLGKYLWRATISADAEAIIDLVFDATDIEQANYMVYSIIYDEKAAELMKRLVAITPNVQADCILAWFNGNDV